MTILNSPTSSPTSPPRGKSKAYFWGHVLIGLGFANLIYAAYLFFFCEPVIDYDPQRYQMKLVFGVIKMLIGIYLVRLSWRRQTQSSQVDAIRADVPDK